jgi:hypothetical protein
MLAVLHGERPDRVPTGELGIDYPITEHVLGRPRLLPFPASLRDRKSAGVTRL